MLTDAGGTWRLVVRPRDRNDVQGDLERLDELDGDDRRAAGRHAARAFAPPVRNAVAGAHSFAGRTVQLQRHLLDGRWLTIARARLNSRSAAIFHPKLKHGRWTLRVAISVNQAGGGYLAGFSTWVTVRRR